MKTNIHSSVTPPRQRGSNVPSFGHPRPKRHVSIMMKGTNPSTQPRPPLPKVSQHANPSCSSPIPLPIEKTPDDHEVNMLVEHIDDMMVTSPVTQRKAGAALTAGTPGASPFRRRLDTADTPLIHNLPETTHVHNFAVNHDFAVNQVRDLSEADGNDHCSLVSSLSNDDSLVLAARYAANYKGGHDNSPLPSEVHIALTDVKNSPSPVQEEIERDLNIPEWLAVDTVERGPCAPSLPPRITASGLCLPPPPPRVRIGPSPQIPRPTFGRSRTCPSMEFGATPSIAGTSSFSNSKNSASAFSNYSQSTFLQEGSIPLDAIIVNGHLVNGISRRGGSDQDSFTDNAAAHNSGSLLGRRPRRRHRRHQSGGTFGSTAMSSSFTASSSQVAAPALTVMSSGSSMTGITSNYSVMCEANSKLNAVTGQADGAACCQTYHERNYRKKNVVKEEVKYMLGRIKTPIKNLPLVRKVSRGDVDLKRAAGCLT